MTHTKNLQHKALVQNAFHTIITLTLQRPSHGHATFNWQNLDTIVLLVT